MMCLRGVRLFVACYECIILSRSNYDSMSYFYVLNCFSSPDCWSERKKNPSVLHQMSNQSYWAYIYCFHWFLRNLFVLATMNRLVVERKVEKFHAPRRQWKLWTLAKLREKKYEMTQFTVCSKAEKSGGDVMVVLGFEWKAKIMKN